MSKSLETFSLIADRRPATTTAFSPPQNLGPAELETHSISTSDFIEGLGNRASDISSPKYPDLYYSLRQEEQREFRVLWDLVQEYKSLPKNEAKKSPLGNRIFSSGMKILKLDGLNIDLTEFFKSNNISLNYAELNGAHLDCARLNGAELNHAVLNDAFFDDAQLNYAQLNHAQLNGVGLHRAKLNHAKLNHAQLNDRVGLDDAELNHAELNYAELNEALLNNAELNEAKLNHAILNRAQLSGARLNRAELNHTFLNGAEFSSNTEMQGASFNGVVASTILIDGEWKRVSTEKEEIIKWFNDQGATISFAEAA